MPRPADPANLPQQMRQARYREKLDTLGEPEANTVDTAMAAALAAYADAVSDKLGSSSHQKVLNALIQGAILILESKGYGREPIQKVMRRRLYRVARPDLEAIAETSKIRTRIAKL